MKGSRGRLCAIQSWKPPRCNGCRCLKAAGLSGVAAGDPQDQ